MRINYTIVVWGLVLILTSRNAPAQSAQPDRPWTRILEQTIPAFGHRNWIVVADSAYPEQSRQGLETIVSGEEQLTALGAVLDAIGRAKHVSPNFYTDRELNYLHNADVPGIDTYKSELSERLRGAPVNSLPHEQIISKLDQVAQTFRVLVIKTTMTMPYTSIFIQLDCKYWTPEQERALRKKITESKTADAK